MKKIIWGIVCCLFVFSVRAETIPPDALLSRFIRKSETFSATFTQTKRIPNIPRTFIGKGHVKWTKDKGIAWIQETPDVFMFKSNTETYCINNTVSPLKKLPQFSKIQHLINDIFATDYNQLENLFQIQYGEMNHTSWHLTLAPNVSDIKKILSQISLSGDESHIKRAIITYVNGTTVQFDFEKEKDAIDDDFTC